ncbi:actinin alpha 1/4 [Nematocida sp. AWRm80]|nr:actinin alpha 1/4 [Nematocida sp. AWRm80]
MKEETWESVQIRTFTNWVNSKLEKGEERSREENNIGLYSFKKVENLGEDLRDGLVLVSLVYALSGSVLRYNPEPKMIIHKIENIHKVLEYLKVHNNMNMVNIGAEDIQEGSIKLTLALIWRLILAFSLQEIKERIGGDRDLINALKQWCREKTENYSKVDIVDFENSWRDGLAVSALVHSDIGGYIYDEGTPEEIATRAIEQAHAQMGVSKLISGTDLVSGLCDEKSILTYVMELYSASKKLEDSQQKIKEQKSIEQARESVKYAQDKLRETNTLVTQEILSLEKQKKDLDTIYNRVREAEKEKTASEVSYLLAEDIFNRLYNPYSPYTQNTLTTSIFCIPKTVGIYDSLSFNDTMNRWNTPEIKQTEDNNDILVYTEKLKEVSSELLTISGIVSFTGVIYLLENLESSIEGILQDKKNQSNLFKANFKELECEASSKTALFSIHREIKDGLNRFRSTFRKELEKEKDLMKRFSPEECDSIDTSIIPSPSPTDMHLFKEIDHYTYVVSKSLIFKKEGNTHQLTAISLNSFK